MCRRMESRTEPAAAPTAASNDPVGIVVMDGACALCAASARRIARMDRRDEIRIATVQSPFGRRLAEAHGVDPDDPETWLYVADGRAYERLDAVIALGKRLGGVGRLAAVFAPLPRSARDWVYRRIARNRYRLFGRDDLCAAPDPAVRRRLIGETR